MRSRHDAPDHVRVRRIARWLALATVLLILYGSLFPFRFSALRDIDPWALVTGLDFVRTSRGDLVANGLLYAPLGLCLMLTWPARWTRVLGGVSAVLIGAILSLCVELLQGQSSSRVASLTDVALNAAGTAIGALAAILYLAIGGTIRIPGATVGRPEPISLALIALWLAFRLAPFVPTIDWQKYKDALKPLLLTPDPAWFEVVRYTVGWLVVGFAVHQLWRRRYAVYAFIALATVVQIGRVVVVGKALSASEVAALALCIPAAAGLNGMPDRRGAGLVALLLAIVIVIAGLQPFHFQAQAQEFSWIPFMYSINGNVEVNSSVLLEKCFWYFSLIWLLMRLGTSGALATLATAALLTLIEVLQLWIVDRSAEITDPLLALTGGVLLAILARSR